MIYLDLVMILNFLVDFLLLLGTNRLAGFPPGYGRAALSALLGGVYAGACMIPGFRFLGNLLWRAVSLILMALLCFGCDTSALQRGAVFVILTMALGGIAQAMHGENIGILLLCAGLLWGLCRFSFRDGISRRAYVPVELTWNDRKVSLIALRDTGNTLTDPLTGEQVMVAGADVGIQLLGLTEHQLANPVETVSSGAVPGMRLIPYRTVGASSGMLPAVRLRRARIGDKTMDPLVAFAPSEIARGEYYRMLTGGTV